MRFIRFVAGDQLQPDAGETVPGADYLGVFTYAATSERRHPMDWGKLFDVGMIQSVVRWLMTVVGGSAFVADWSVGHATEWQAIVAGAVALASLAWSYLTVKQQAAKDA